MEICENMQKLRDWLDSKGIEWIDKSDAFERDNEKNMEKELSKIWGEKVSFWMCRTHFHINDKFVSVINGAGSYGGFIHNEKTNAGLLEIMCDWIPDVTGNLSAEEVIEIIEGELNNGEP